MQNTNIPTQILTHFPFILQGLERALTGRPGVLECKTLVVEKSLGHQVLQSTFGNTTLGLPSQVCKALRRDLTKSQITATFALVTKELCACFRGSRLDYKAGRRAGGTFAIAPGRLKDGKQTLGMCRRLTRLMGRNQDKIEQTKLTERALKIVENLSFKITVGNQTIEGAQLIRFCDAQKLKGMIDGEHKGGRWICGEIHPALFDLSLKRFTPLPDEFFELGTTDFNVAMCLLAQSTLKRRPEVHMSLERVLRDSGLTQTTTRGTARSVKRLTKALEAMVKLGLLEEFELTQGKVFTKFAALPPRDHQVGCAHESGSPSLLQGRKKTPRKQGVEARMLALERILRKILSTSRPPQEGGGPLGLEGLSQALAELEHQSHPT